jgi:hypothetical protein
MGMAPVGRESGLASVKPQVQTPVPHTHTHTNLKYISQILGSRKYLDMIFMILSKNRSIVQNSHVISASN